MATLLDATFCFLLGATVAVALVIGLHVLDALRDQ